MVVYNDLIDELKAPGSMQTFKKGLQDIKIAIYSETGTSMLIGFQEGK